MNNDVTGKTAVAGLSGNGAYSDTSRVHNFLTPEEVASI